MHPFTGYQRVQCASLSLFVKRLLSSSLCRKFVFKFPPSKTNPSSALLLPSFSHPTIPPLPAALLSLPRVHAISIFQIEFPGILIFYYFRKLKEKTPPSLSASRLAACQRRELNRREISSYDMHDMCE